MYFTHIFSNIYFETESLLVNIPQTELLITLSLPLLLISANPTAIHPGAQPKPGNDPWFLFSPVPLPLAAGLSLLSAKYVFHSSICVILPLSVSLVTLPRLLISSPTSPQ